jgi:hypothetical protein
MGDMGEEPKSFENIGVPAMSPLHVNTPECANNFTRKFENSECLLRFDPPMNRDSNREICQA